MRKSSSWALILVAAMICGSGCIVQDDVGEDLVVEWRLEGSTNASLCTTYGIDRWVVSVNGPVSDSRSFPCGSAWDSGAAFAAANALVVGGYTVTVTAEDATSALLATKSNPVSIGTDLGGVERLTFVFLASDFGGGVICNNDGNCEPGQGETEINCPNDCAPVNPCNNDGVCEPGQGETNANCPNDCVCNNDGSCEPGAGEDEINCPNDCPNPCNFDGFCQPGAGEDAQNCPSDC